MCCKSIFEILTAIGTLGAVIVAMIAISYSNKNSRLQIRSNKLEELFEIIQSLSRYYGKFNELMFTVQALHDKENKDIRTMAEYFIIRDQKLPEGERKLILDYLSRIEVLSKCYTKGELLQKVLEYEDLMYSFADYVFNTGSLHMELKWKNGFPDYDAFFARIEDLKTRIVGEIKLK